MPAAGVQCGENHRRKGKAAGESGAEDEGGVGGGGSSVCAALPHALARASMNDVRIG